MTILSLVVLGMIPLMSNVSAQGQCASELAGIQVMLSDGRKILLDSNMLFMAYLPPTWDSFYQASGYHFVPCENPSVQFGIVALNLPTDLTTDQFAQKLVDYYNAQGGQGYHVVGAEYLEGRNEYSMVLAAEGSNTPTLWYAFIPIADTGILYVTAFKADSPVLYNQYGGEARAIYESIQWVTQTQANEFMIMFSEHNQAMAAGSSSAVEMANEAGLQAWENVIDLLDAGTQFDRELREENERYQREREQGLRP